VDDVEDFGNRETEFVGDLADGHCVVEEAGEDEAELRAGVRGKG
jgi:hypothetical protein